MVKVAEEIVRKVTSRKDSIDKQRRLEYAHSLPEKFPSLSWYIRQRPPETKPLCDHTTGLCHICEAARKNFDSLVKAAKRTCSCSQKSCPMWFCACPVPENDDEDIRCSCPPCECDICSSCQVSLTLYYSEIFKPVKQSILVVQYWKLPRYRSCKILNMRKVTFDLDFFLSLPPPPHIVSSNLW